MRRLLIILTASVAVAQSPGGPQGSKFEGQPAVTLSNDRLQMTVLLQGSSIASLVMTDDAEKLSPYWNPTRLAREADVTTFQMSAGKETGGSSMTFTAKLPIVQEVFTRTFHMVEGENVVYVD